MLVIKDALISTGNLNDTQKVSIFIDGEIISKVEESDVSIPEGAEVIDAAGLLLLPGGIDPHVHFDTPGYEDREDFQHGTEAAAAGGVTTIIDMPDTSIPSITNTGNLQQKLDVIQDQAAVDFALWGGVSHNSMIEEYWHDSMAELWETGVVGFKVYLISGMETFKELSIIEMGQVMQHATKLGALIGLHAEEKDIVQTRTEELQKQKKNTLQDYYFSRSDPVESQGVSIGIHLARQTKCTLHIVHVGSATAAEVIARSKAMGVDLTAETCPHYLHFTYDDFEKLGSMIKTSPVVKTRMDRDGLWVALEDQTLDFVATDHAPCPMKEKQTGSCWSDYAGLPGVETRLPYLFSFGYMKKRLTLARFIEVTSSGAAKRFGIYPRKGAIQIGSDADFVLIDPSAIWTIKGEDLHSKAKWTPFDGLSINGKILKTILRGKMVFDSEKGLTGPKGFGQWIKRIK